MWANLNFCTALLMPHIISNLCFLHQSQYAKDIAKFQNVSLVMSHLVTIIIMRNHQLIHQFYLKRGKIKEIRGLWKDVDLKMRDRVQIIYFKFPGEWDWPEKTVAVFVGFNISINVLNPVALNRKKENRNYDDD